MVILAIDTATRAGSVALAIGDGADVSDRIEVDARTGDATRTHGERLPQEVLELLSAHRLSLAEVDEFAVIVGPGSFTGLRVGVATVQGFALARARRIVPVPTLEALLDGWGAQEGRHAGVGIAWMDGQRGDVFYGGWQIDSTGRRGAVVVDPRVGRPADLVNEVRTLQEGPIALVRPGPVRGGDEVTRALATAMHYTYAEPLAGVAALRALRQPELGVVPHAVRPIYLRRPDAELTRRRARAAAEEPELTVVRVAPGDDLSAIADLQRRSFTNPWGAEAIQWELANTDVARLYVAKGPDGRVSGYCACWLLFDELHINSLAVDEALRRRGVARVLLRAVFRDAVTAGARSATLEVRRSNEAARRLYENLGFLVEGLRRDYYQLPREDALILWHRHLAGPGVLW